MSQVELLAFFSSILRQLDVEWMLVGSHASSYFGEARSTHDIDVVVDLPEPKIPRLLSAVPTDRYYLSEAAIREGRMANLIDTETGDKVDMFFVHDNDRSRAQLSRRIEAKILGVNVFVSSIEDTIVSKLGWYQQTGGSERQINDVRGIILAQRSRIDFDQLKQGIREAGLEKTWEEQIGTWLEAES